MTEQPTHMDFDMAKLAKLTPPAEGVANYTVWDKGYGDRLGRLGVRVGKTSASFMVQFRVDGKVVRKTVATMDDLKSVNGTPTRKIGWLRDAANDLARSYEKAGITPAEEKEAALQVPEDRTKWTIAQLADYRLATYDYVCPQRVERFAGYATECWGDKAVCDLTPDDAERFKMQMKRRGGGNGATRDAIAVVYGLLNRGIKMGLPIQNGLFRGLRVPKKARRNPLTRDQRQAFLDELDRYEADYPKRAYACEVFRLMLSTGARKTDWLQTQWKQIDFEAGTWFQPTEKRKVGHKTDRSHTQPLVGYHLTILKAIRDRNEAAGLDVGPEGYLWPAVKVNQNKKPFRTVPYEYFHEIIERAGITPNKKDGDTGEWMSFTMHDLRSTAVSHWVRDGFTFVELGALIGAHPQTLATEYAYLDRSLNDVANEAYQGLSHRKRCA
ncbi:MAG: tyrosine-type recombinase/integrase [Pseudomonadota bacterium]